MKPTNVSRPGDNHTGITLHPDLARQMIQGTVEFGPTSSGGPDLLAETRVRVAKQSAPAATMPPTPDIRGEQLALLDKLGARLAFERIGVRLYEALLSKHDAYGAFQGGPSRDDLRLIRDQEHRHMQLAEELVRALGGDPTTVTPTANLQATASRGIGDILVDPRTTLIECLEAILVAELADHESWEMLAAHAVQAGQQELETRLREAERTEAEHLAKVRRWLTAASEVVVD